MRLYLLALIAAFAVATPAAADRFALKYDAAGLGLIPLGTVRINADVSEETYDISTTLVSGGLLNLFERTNIEAAATGRIENGVVRWESYDLDHHYSRKHRQIMMRADPAGVVTAEITPNYRLWGDPPTSDEQKQNSRDPLSSLMAMAVDVGITQRCSGSYPTFDGRFHYLLELSGGEVERYNSGGYDGPALRCTMAYIAVAGFESRDRGRRRVPRGTVWFALAPESRFAPPVRITTPLAAGGATIRLTEWRRSVVTIEDEPVIIPDPSATP
jgi:hypothetical protein